MTSDEISERYGIDLTYQHKTACPRCRRNSRDVSGDNMMVYGSGQGSHCFSCGFTIPSDAHREEMGWSFEEEEDEEVVTREKITEEENKRIKAMTRSNGRDWRGIREETNKFFGVRYSYDTETGEPCAQYVPTTVNYELAGYRVRKFPKDFSGPIGQVGKEVDMIGEFRFRNSKNTCIIVGGESKLLNTYQILKDNIEAKGKGEQWEVPAVVCSTLGESGAWKQVQARYAFFNQFQKIIICMDSDKAGEEATEKIAKVLPKGRVYIMKMRYKDADDYVVDKEGNPVGKEHQWMQDYWKASVWTPDGIVGSGDLADKIREAASAQKVPLPPFMHALQDMMAGGIPVKTIINLGSASGTGKSTIVDECTYHWIFNSPYKPGIVTLESDAGQYGTKILSRHVGHKIDLIETAEEKISFLEQPWVKEKERELYFNEDGSQRFYLIEDRDGGIDSLKEKIEELIIACGCQLIVLDPLQDILDGLGNDEQAVFLKWMKGMVKSHEVIFINVNHVRKSQGGRQANSTGAEIYEEDMQGSSAIFKSGACNLLFSRNKEAEDELERNTTKMKASKIRWTGKTGVAGNYYYDNQTHTMWDLDDWLKENGVKSFDEG